MPHQDAPEITTCAIDLASCFLGKSSIPLAPQFPRTAAYFAPLFLNRKRVTPASVAGLVKD